MEFKSNGNKLFSQGKVREATEAYSAGIDFLENHDEENDEDTTITEEDKGCLHLLYGNRSMLHLKQVMVDEALQDAELAIETNPEYAKAYLRRAAVLVDLFKNKDALLDIEKAAELNGGVVDEDLRNRALGKTWVPNCYLQMRMELSRKLKCNYVVIGTDPDAEDYLTRMTHSSGPEYLAKMLAGVDKYGPTKFQESSEASGPTFGHLLDMLEDSKASDNRTEKELKHRNAIKAQLEREFGPNLNFSSPKAKANLHSSVDRCKLFLGVMQAHAMKAPGADCVFLPGAPKWCLVGATKKGGKLDGFEETVLWERTIRPRPKAKFHDDVNLSGNFSSGAQQLREYRQKFEGRESKCIGCGIAVSDPDPQECLCGKIYCSFTCHAKHWPRHRESCKKSLSTLSEEVIKWTVWYWELVLLGYYPCKDELDIVALWRERNIPAGKTKKEQQDSGEMRFYMDHEVKTHNAERLAMAQGNHIEQYYNEAEHSGRSFTRFANALVDDTPMRLNAKLEMYTHCMPRAVSHFKYLTAGYSSQFDHDRLVPVATVEAGFDAYFAQHQRMRNNLPPNGALPPNRALPPNGALPPAIFACSDWAAALLSGQVAFVVTEFPERNQPWVGKNE